MRCALVVNDIVENVVEADLPEWCNDNLGGNWIEVPEYVSVGDSIYYRNTFREAIHSLEMNLHYRQRVPRNTRGFQVFSLKPITEADGYRSVFPVPIEALCSGEDFFLVPTSVLKNGVMDPVNYLNYLELPKGSVTHHEIVYRSDTWAIAHNIMGSDVFQRTATGEVDSAMFAPTMEEVYLLLFEWEWAYSQGSREPAALLALTIINELGLDQIRDEVLAIDRPMQLGAYLSGEPWVPLSDDPTVVLLPADTLSRITLKEN